MIFLDIEAAQADLDRVLEQVHAGTEVIITRAGEPLARLVPPDDEQDAS